MKYRVFKVSVDGDTNSKKIRELGKLMAGLAWKGKRNRTIRVKTLDIIHKAGVKPQDWVGEATAVMVWVQHNIRYFLDPHGVEYFQAPERTLIDKAGDCDDLSILYAAMLGSIGHRTAIVLTDPKNKGVISHAQAAINFYPRRTKFGDKWVSVELTKPKPLGWIPPKSTVRIIVEIPR